MSFDKKKRVKQELSIENLDWKYSNVYHWRNINIKFENLILKFVFDLVFSPGPFVVILLLFIIGTCQYIFNNQDIAINPLKVWDDNGIVS